MLKNKYVKNYLTEAEFDHGSKWIFDNFCKSENKSNYLVMSTTILSKILKIDCKEDLKYLEKEILLCPVPCNYSEEYPKNYFILMIT